VFFLAFENRLDQPPRRRIIVAQPNAP